MPRLTALRVAPLERLALDLRFAPRATLLRQIEAAERLAGEIDTDRAYPLAWVAKRLTGFRPEAGEADEVSLPGAALAGDLSAFVERLSTRAALTARDCGAGALSLEALCARWGVTRKTIERKRREGLVGRRIVGKGGRPALMFTMGAVEQFERRSAIPPNPTARRRTGAQRNDGPTKAARAPRADARTREKVARLARRGKAREGWSSGEAATRIASTWGERLGVSRATAKRAVRRRDRESDAPTFADERGPVDARKAEVARRAWKRGVSVAVLAARLGRSRASIHRVVNERRAALLRALDLACPESPLFERPDAAGTLLAPPAVREGLLAPPETDARSFRASAIGAPPPSESDELARAAAMCFLRWRARRAIGALPRFNPSSTALDAIETDLRWAEALCIAQARSLVRLALRSIEERAGVALTAMAPHAARAAHEAAMGAIVRAAWAFDPFEALGARDERRRLAAAATSFLTKALAGLAERDARPRAAVPKDARPVAQRTRAAPGATAHAALMDWTAHAAPWSAWLGAPGGVRERLAAPGGLDAPGSLDAAHREAVRLRYGWGDERSEGIGSSGGSAACGGAPMTLAQIASAMGVTRSRAGALALEGERMVRGLTRRARTRERIERTPRRPKERS